VAPRPVPRVGLLDRLGAELRETPFGTYPVVDQTGLTSVPGVWAAGNAAGFAEQVVNAASGGYRAAATLNGELLFSDLDAAVARGRGQGLGPGSSGSVPGTPGRSPATTAGPAARDGGPGTARP
jgi:hypothetical protein